MQNPNIAKLKNEIKTIYNNALHNGLKKAVFLQEKCGIILLKSRKTCTTLIVNLTSNYSYYYTKQSKQITPISVAGTKQNLLPTLTVATKQKTTYILYFLPQNKMHMEIFSTNLSETNQKTAHTRLTYTNTHFK